MMSFTTIPRDIASIHLSKCDTNGITLSGVVPGRGMRREPSDAAQFALPGKVHATVSSLPTLPHGKTVRVELVSLPGAFDT
jgi:hypothetical protein